MRIRSNMLMSAISVVFAIIACNVGTLTADVIVFQQGVESYDGTRDIHLRQDDMYSHVDHNTGGEIYLVTGQYTDNNDNDNARILVNFEGLGDYTAPLQAANQQITAAKLKLYLAGTAGIASSTAQTLDIFNNATAFTEGTGSSAGGRDGAQAQSGESCYNYSVWNTNQWAGGSHSSSDWGSALDTGLALTGADVGSWVEFDVTAAFAPDGSNLGTQLGFVILSRVDNANPYQDNTQGGMQFLFSSRNSGSNAPILEFTITPVPEPSSVIMSIGGLLGLLAYAWRKRR